MKNSHSILIVALLIGVVGPTQTTWAQDDSGQDYAILLDKFVVNGQGAWEPGWFDDFDDGDLGDWVCQFGRCQDEPGTSFARLESPGRIQSFPGSSSALRLERSDLASWEIWQSYVSPDDWFQGLAIFAAELPKTDESISLQLNSQLDDNGRTLNEITIVEIYNYSDEISAMADGVFPGGLRVAQFRGVFDEDWNFLYWSNWELESLTAPAVLGNVILSLRFEDGPEGPVFHAGYSLTETPEVLEPFTPIQSNMHTTDEPGSWVIRAHVTSVAETDTYSWTGTIVSVEVDDGTGIYAGTQVGDTFSGTFTYDPDVANIAGISTSDGDSVIGPGDVWVEYHFDSSSSAVLTDGTTELFWPGATLSITTDYVLDEQDELDWFDWYYDLFGIELTVGALSDGWGLDFGDGKFGLEIQYGSGVNMQDDLSFRPNPPWSPPASPDDPDNQIATFEIHEYDDYDQEELIYFAIGVVDSDGDRDGDGIEDGIDGIVNGVFTDQSTVFSDDFTDQHLGGSTHGSIIDRSDNLVTVSDSPVGGVALVANGGIGTSHVQMCGPSNGDIFNVFLTDGHVVGNAHCGSFTAEVISGPVTVSVGMNISVTIPTGAIAFMDVMPGSILSISNLSDPGGPDIVIDDDGVVTNLGLAEPPFMVIVEVLPDAPDDVIGRAKPGKVNLHWTPVEADSCDVYRSGRSGGPYNLIGSVNRNVFVDTGLTTGETYFYVVQAVTAIGSSENSNEVEVLVPARRSRR